MRPEEIPGVALGGARLERAADRVEPFSQPDETRPSGLGTTSLRTRLSRDSRNCPVTDMKPAR